MSDLTPKAISAGIFAVAALGVGYNEYRLASSPERASSTSPERKMVGRPRRRRVDDAVTDGAAVRGDVASDLGLRRARSMSRRARDPQTERETSASQSQARRRSNPQGDSPGERNVSPSKSHRSPSRHTSISSLPVRQCASQNTIIRMLMWPTDSPIALQHSRKSHRSR